MTNTTQQPDFVTIAPNNVPHMGMRQIEAEYGLTGAKAHRLIKKSGLEPYIWFNKHFFPVTAVRAYFESLLLPLVAPIKIK